MVHSSHSHRHSLPADKEQATHQSCSQAGHIFFLVGEWTLTNVLHELLTTTTTTTQGGLSFPQPPTTGRMKGLNALQIEVYTSFEATQ